MSTLKLEFQKIVLLTCVVLAIYGCSGKSGGSASVQNTAPAFAGLVLVAANDTTVITAAWLDAKDDTTPPAQIKYSVYVSTDPNFTPTAETLNKTVVGEKQTVITGLAAGTTYYLQVVAVDKEGVTSSTSNLAAAAVTTLTSPVVLSATTPLVKAADLQLAIPTIVPTIVGAEYQFPYTGVETLPPVGGILVGADAGGSGYLVKVTGASIVDGKVVVQTTQGTLSEAVEQGGINTNLTLFDNPATPNNTVGIAAGLKLVHAAPASLKWRDNLLSFEESAGVNPPGLHVSRNAETGRYKITSAQTNGANRSIAAGVVTGTASEELTYDIGITFTPNLATKARWSTGIPSGFTLHEGLITASGTLTLDASAAYNFAGAKSFTKDVTFDVFKRTWRSVYQVGAVPVYQEIIFTLGAQLTANATAAVNASADSSISKTVTFGVQYNPATSAWEAVAPTSSRADSLTADLSVRGGVDSAIRLIPNIEVKFYKAVSGNLSFEPVLMGNIEAASIANANFLAGYFPPGITQLTAFDAALGAQCFVGANLQLWLSPTISVLDKTQVCDIPVYTFFSLPELALSSQRQVDGSHLLTANVVDGTNNLFNDASIKWTVYPANAGTITAGPSRQATFKFNPAVNVNTATVFFSGYGKLGELGRQFVQADLTDRFSSVTGGCVKDNLTGLIWEVKTADGGLRDWNKTYTNYDSTLSAQKYNSATGVPSNPTQAEINASTNSVGFKNAVNATNLCGFSDWRLPTVSELQGIEKIDSVPAIDTAWFPNTQAGAFWSASPFVGLTYLARFVDFSDRNVYGFNRGFSGHVRLVRAGQ